MANFVNRFAIEADLGKISITLGDTQVSKNELAIPLIIPIAYAHHML